jgi:hypothetical protein
MDAQELLKQAREALQGGSAAAAENKAPAAPPAWHGAPLPRGYTNVTDAVEVPGCDLLNADGDAGSLRVLFDTSKPSSLGSGSAKAGSKDWVESGADDQLLLFIPFHSTVKLHTIQITSLPPTESDEEPPMRPASIKLFTNRPHSLDFSEADDTSPEQEIEISQRDWNSDGTANLSLRFVKFQNISSLIIYVVRGDGDGTRVRLDRIRLIGETGEKRQGKIEKIGDDD